MNRLSAYSKRFGRGMGPRVLLTAAAVLFIVSAMPIRGQEFPRLGQLINAGKLDEAQRVIDQELERAPGHPELLYWQAALQARSGRVEQAQETLRGVIESGKGNPPHYLLLGSLFNARQQFDKSAQVYREALARQYSPRMVYNLALAEFRAGNHQKTVEALQPVVKDPRATAPFHHLLGLAYFALNNFEESLPHLDKALELQPDNAKIHYDYALALLQANEFEQAEKEFRRTLELEPTWARAHLYLGRALHDQNYGEDALEHFEKARDLKPDLPLLHHHFGLAYRGRGEFDKAIEEFEKEIAGGGGSPPTYYQLADLLYMRQELGRSKELAAKAIESSPRNAEYRVLAAKMALRENNLEEADRHLAVALESEPANDQAYWLLGRLRQAQGRPEDAKAAFEKSRRIKDQKSQRKPE